MNENNKDSRELKMLKKLVFAPGITNILLIFMIGVQNMWGKLPVPYIVTIVICILTNFISLGYFKKKIEQLDTDGRKNSRIVTLLLIVMIVILSIVVLIPWLLF